MFYSPIDVFTKKFHPSHFSIFIIKPYIPHAPPSSIYGDSGLQGGVAPLPIIGEQDIFSLYPFGIKTLFPIISLSTKFFDSNPYTKHNFLYFEGSNTLQNFSSTTLARGCFIYMLVRPFPFYIVLFPLRNLSG